MRGARIAAAAVLSLSLLAPLAWAQCAMCRASIERSEEGRRVAGELNQAILVMFLAPYLVFGTCATVLFRRRISAFLRRHARLAAPSATILPERTPIS